jgi:hypothetical protein
MAARPKLLAARWLVAAHLKYAAVSPLDESAISGDPVACESLLERQKSEPFMAAAHVFTVRESGTDCVVVGNAQETIAPVHTSFAVLLSPAFRRHASKSRTGLQKGVEENGTASNRDFLSIGSGLSEIGITLATGMLDRTGTALLPV